jgi:hypothetical protein
MSLSAASLFPRGIWPPRNGRPALSLSPLFDEALEPRQKIEGGIHNGIRTKCECLRSAAL